MFCDDAWIAAQRDQDEDMLELRGVKILDEIHHQMGEPCELGSVEEIARVIREWGRAFLLCIDALASHVVP